MLEKEVSLMSEEKIITLEKLYAERFRTGEQLQFFRLKDIDKFLCPDCNILMNRVLPSVWFCSHCGNLISEELGNETLNFPDTYHLTNIREALYTVRVAPIEQNVNVHHDMHHEVKLKTPLKRTKAWLEKRGRKKETVQITEEEYIEEKEEACSVNVVQPETNGSSEARENEG